MPPRSNSTPCTQENESSVNSTNVSSNSTTSSTNSTSALGTTGTTTRARFGYSESLQRRFIQGFLRQNSADDFTNNGKKKSSKDTVNESNTTTTTTPTTPPCSPSPSTTNENVVVKPIYGGRTFSLSGMKSNSVPSIVRRCDSAQHQYNKQDSLNDDCLKNKIDDDKHELSERPSTPLANRVRPKIGSVSNQFFASVGSSTTSELNVSLSIPSIVVNDESIENVEQSNTNKENDDEECKLALHLNIDDK
ncbi:hypothetical protein BLOT_006102 [Blomia tropicalis]|nr:hypothetical protein BLOT_006102 [Blomia tropicalis]